MYIFLIVFLICIICFYKTPDEIFYDECMKRGINIKKVRARLRQMQDVKPPIVLEHRQREADRLNEERMMNYCKELGIDYDPEYFYFKIRK